MPDGLLDPFRPPRVKVCGLCCAEDVRGALEAGADGLGFVHHAPSVRSIAAAEAASLVALVPRAVLTVGVLVDVDPASAFAWAKVAGVRALQLCGAQSARDWAGFPLPILRRIAVAKGAERELEDWSGIARAFVLDHPASPGGSGRAVDLALAARLARSALCLLAGGLDAENVALRIEAVRPAGVDASSRLERAPGRKDPEHVRSFVRRALESLQEVRA